MKKRPLPLPPTWRHSRHQPPAGDQGTWGPQRPWLPSACPSSWSTKTTLSAFPCVRGNPAAAAVGRVDSYLCQGSQESAGEECYSFFHSCSYFYKSLPFPGLQACEDPWSGHGGQQCQGQDYAHIYPGASYFLPISFLPGPTYLLILLSLPQCRSCRATIPDYQLPRKCLTEQVGGLLLLPSAAPPSFLTTHINPSSSGWPPLLPLTTSFL